MMYSHARRVNAMMESVVVLSVTNGKTLASQTYRFATSWHCENALVTEVFGSLPNRHVPVSCRLCPGESGSDPAPQTSPPARRMISAQTCLACSHIINSFGPQLK